jgi:hypothetical protein
MRTLLPTFAFMLLAAPALAGSIEPVAGASSEPKHATYQVDAIDHGTQKVEIREENGERKIFRTEAWMGGSPVLFVSKAPAEVRQAAAVETTVDEKATAVETVDAGAHTSALDETAARKTAAAGMATSQEFDPSGFELRVN